MENKWINNKILENAQMGFYSLDREWKFTNLSLQALELNNREPEVLIGKVIWDEFPEFVGTPVERVLREVMENNVPQRIDLYGIHNDRCYNTLVQPLLEGIFISWNDVTMQKMELRQSKEKYQMLFNLIDQGFFIIDIIFDENNRPLDMYYVEANAASIRILGKDFTGKRLTEINPDYESYWFEVFGEVALTGKSRRMEQYAEPDEKWYSFYIFKIDGENDGRIGNIFLDITEQKRLEESLRKSEEKLRMVLENSLDGINLFDLTTRKYDYINEAQKELTGFTAEEIANITPEEFYNRVHLEDREGFAQYHNQLADELNTTKDLEYRWKVKSGEYRWFNDRHKQILDSQGHPIARVGNSRDITQIKDFNETLLRKSEEKFRMLFNKIDEGFCIIEMIFDPKEKPVDYRVIETNTAFVDQTGLHNAEGKLMRELRPEHEEHWFEIYGKVALTGEPIRFVNEAKALNRWYDVYAFKMEPYNIKNAVAVLFTDVTKSVLQKNELEKSLRIMDDVFANISHELKTPLNVILSTNQMMEMYLNSESLEFNRKKMLRWNNTIKQNCFRFTKLINNIVDLSKMDSGFFKLNMRNLNIVSIVENIVQSVSDFAEGKDLSVIFESDLDEKIIAFDPEMIERVILNLISNAIKYSSLGGKIYVSVSDKYDYVQISIKDNGSGIEERYLEDIFIRFQQIDKALNRKAEGTGIGLSLVKSIIDMHDGKISVESVVGEGSDFKIALPIRIVQEANATGYTTSYNDKIESIQIEFSDILSLS